jgi:hypothetical protein
MGSLLKLNLSKPWHLRERLEQLGSKEALKETGSPWFLEKEVSII